MPALKGLPRQWLAYHRTPLAHRTAGQIDSARPPPTTRSGSARHSAQRGGASPRIESPTMISPGRTSWYIPERSALPFEILFVGGKPLHKRYLTALASETQPGSMSKNCAISDSRCRVYGPGQSLWPTLGSLSKCLGSAAAS